MRQLPLYMGCHDFRSCVASAPNMTRSSHNRVPARIGREVSTSMLLIERTMSGQSATFATIANAVAGVATMSFATSI
ncbi:hypothetical protein QA635_08050 [Bradyrhizobium brasilense]|uniref:hypothetical protein n=1 Tax=Bradyrhizobium brasilense TaxID=1419277 RepID=UPI0024B239D3|nr:hypothetical protein [Bradyrhizobium australafricanum]WFU34361.1 hypothetical protein QA635_08050 [Bradyrhizobium australafricanum]